MLRPKPRPVPRAGPRLRSLDADAYHSIGAMKGSSYLGCTARFMGDDAINIHGDYDMIMASEGRELRVLAKGGLNIHADDPVELVSYDGRRLPDARAVAITPAGTIRDDERAFLGRQHLDEGLRTARGALNHAYTITTCLGTAINIEAMGGDGQIAPAGAHRDIAIAGNAIAGCPLPAIRVTSTDGLRLEHNRVGSPGSGNPATRGAGKEPVQVINCANVTPGNR